MKVILLSFHLSSQNLSLSSLTDWSPNSSLLFRLSHNPVSTYHYYFISPHALQSSTWQFTCIPSRIPKIPYFPACTPKLVSLLLPNMPSPPCLLAHLRHPLLHDTFLVPLRHTSPPPTCFMYLADREGSDRCITTILCSLLLTCTFPQSQDLATISRNLFFSNFPQHGCRYLLWTQRRKKRYSAMEINKNT